MRQIILKTVTPFANSKIDIYELFNSAPREISLGGRARALDTWTWWSIFKLRPLVLSADEEILRKL